MNDDISTSAPSGDRAPRARSRRQLRLASMAVSGFALLAAQGVQASIPCPEADGNWDIGKIQDFALYTGGQVTGQKRQIMLCLHRGHHDNGPDHGVYIRIHDVPDNSARAIQLGAEMAPCVEIDVAGTEDRFGNPDTILSHDSKTARAFTKARIFFPTGVTPPTNCNFTSSETGGYVYTCNMTPAYNPSTDTYKGPTSGNKFPFISAGGAYYDSLGFYRETLSTDTTSTAHPAQQVNDVFDMVSICRDTKNLGLFVLDAKDINALVEIKEELAFRDSTDDEPPEFFRHFMVKFKPWKMYNSSTELTFLKDVVQDLEDLGVPVLDTIVQSGTGYNATAAQPDTTADYSKAKDYYKWRAQTNQKNSGPWRAIELTVPGNVNWDPIAADTQKLWWRNGCNKTSGTGEYPLDTASTDIWGLMSTCNLRPRSGSNKSYMPQIWGWVPMPEGYVTNLLNGNGSTATPALPAGQTYRKYGQTGKYAFGVPYGSMNPLPFINGKDTQELDGTWVTTNLVAGVITIDSIKQFESQFGTSFVEVNQNYFKRN